MKNRISDKGRLKRHHSNQTYRPWIRVHDFSSKGLVSRIYSELTGRVHHLLSQLETKVFYWCEWFAKEIKEQYALLPLSETIEIAALAGLHHPQVNGAEVIMSTDFLVDLDEGPIAISVKPSSKLTARTLAKLEIERQYFERRKIPYYIITEKEIPEIFIKNICLARQAAKRPDISVSDNKFLSDLIQYPEANGSILQTLQKMAIQYECTYPELKNLYLHLIWKKRISFDLSVKHAMDLKKGDYDITN
ncbi:MAG TPA: TnsA endonuclease N-terminal domain-containing protein [Cyclobacteriaceae bacterium]|nr:TnsA endonuclease N-terminal domain-containing protein [Cyclobacteriaceae bacterium]HMV07491.1 TnsA endonuclease N-terminal domain-containing protein [Cyclobacteriaceae bacterium]HMW99154.1 TnsA endonuclease N-terminal domain-containing protein [Cyclobacteriaceae bacterium]HMX48213.1 TnsA endonuclease N-terminal domain-containing protein [Cyclobacteriaceae bacterium]HMY95018.1 TnsA endonuclease N-terminal domain-containing protein [Cyclobacteriaceae bacterium]